MATGNNTASQNEVLYAESLVVNGVPLTGAGLGATAGVTAGTAAASKAMVTDANVGITGFRDTRATPAYVQAAPTAMTGTATMTAAALMGGLVVGTPAAAAAYTLPLVSSLEAAFIAAYPGLQNNDSFDFTVINVATGDTFAITMTTNTGWTLVGKMVIEEQDAASPGSSATFRARRVSSSAYTLYRIS